jgi:Tfp pilus assembly protein PilX
LSRQRNCPTRFRHRESGFVLIAVLVCLGVIVALIYSSMRISMRQRRILDRELQMEQTRWLVLAAANHAQSADSLQAGSIPIPALSSYESAVVTIELPNGEEGSPINITARIGIDDRPETQTKQSLQIQRKTGSKAGSSEDKR